MSEPPERDRLTDHQSTNNEKQIEEASCPRCSGDLAWFRLGDHTATECEACGYVGVPVDHHARGDGPTEAWDDAVEQARLSTVDMVANTTAEGPDPTIEELLDSVEPSPYRLEEGEFDSQRTDDGPSDGKRESSSTHG